MSRPPREALRYGVIVTLGLAVDLATARALAGAGLPLEAAAAIGVGAGAVVNYLLLERYAFRGPKTGSAMTRPLRYLGALAITMLIRSGAVWALEAALPAGTAPLVILGGGVGVSFAANFALSKYWVFRRAEGA